MLEFQGVTMYRKEKKILDDFSLVIKEGSIYGLLGTDQVTKSMLLKAASGSEEPDIGRILLDGESIYGKENNRYASFGYMPGKYGFYEALRVEEYMELFLALYKVNGRYRERRIEEVLSFMNLQQYRYAFIGEIPSEILPFLCLAKTILHEPDWILLDEPFSQLNIIHRKKMSDLLLMLWERGVSIIINSQMYPELQNFFTDIAVIEDGNIMANGSVADVYNEVIKNSPIRVKVISGIENAVNVLKENHLVERVVIDRNEIIIRFEGEEKEEAELLSQLVGAGTLIHSFQRDHLNFDQIIRR